jgi:hypothetical protein
MARLWMEPAAIAAAPSALILRNAVARFFASACLIESHNALSIAIGNAPVLGSPMLATVLPGRGLPLHTYLLTIAVAAIVPPICVAVVLSLLGAHLGRQRIQENVGGMARSLAASLDGDLRATVAALKAIALSRNVRDRDWRAIYTQASALREQYPLWHSVGYVDTDGQLAFNLLQPLGTPLPRLTDI